MRSKLFSALLAITIGAFGPARALDRPPGTSDAELDRLIERAMQVFEVPGVAVAIVQDGAPVFAKGYGVRTLGKPEKVDTATLFAIGSNSKAVTAAALAILVDEGKIRWDDKVIDHLPAFRLFDANATREFTIRDLLTHRSGLPESGGDLLFFPDADFTPKELIERLRYLKPASSFRSRFDYNNLFYVVAGEVVRAVTGTSWEEFVETRILRPVGMNRCAALRERLPDPANLAAPHAIIGGKLQATFRENLALAAPAGGIACDLDGMIQWVRAQLAGGQVFSSAQQAEMWSPQTIVPVSPDAHALNGTHFSAYGLGWVLEDLHGEKLVWHDGSVTGMVSYVALLPEKKLGVVVLTNQQSEAATKAIVMHILHAYTGAAPKNWVGDLKRRIDQQMAEARKIEAAAMPKDARPTPPPLPLAAYVGTYHDAWRGEATIQQNGDRLRLKFSRSVMLDGVLEHRGGGVFIARWNDRRLASADAYVRFLPDYAGGIERMEMRLLSPLGDTSYDFQDLDFRKSR